MQPRFTPDPQNPGKSLLSYEVVNAGFMPDAPNQTITTQTSATEKGRYHWSPGGFHLLARNVERFSSSTSTGDNPAGDIALSIGRVTPHHAHTGLSLEPGAQGTIVLRTRVQGSKYYDDSFSRPIEVSFTVPK